MKKNPQNSHLVVLTARNNPLATSDREVCKDTVLLVLVPSVCLQTLALGHFIVLMHLFKLRVCRRLKLAGYLGVIPQLEGVVQSGSQDVLP